MVDRPQVVLSCATTLDGALDDSSPTRLVISDAADLARVDAERAACDAILVGPGTVRADNPRLLVRDPRLRAERVARGLAASPLRVTFTRSGGLSARAHLFTTREEGVGAPLVFTSAPHAEGLARELGRGAQVVSVSGPLTLGAIAANLATRGVRRLMIEGGAATLAAALAEGVADELQWAVAPWRLGDPAAPSIVPALRHLDGRHLAATLRDVRPCGSVVVFRYRIARPEAAAE
ncbi:RibD family protein [Micrococcales bacterium 31B]|nr:RibD family protein [Micrococcales bacterium 31B]